MPRQLIYGPRPWSAVLGMSAVALGFLGLLFFWLMPVGLVLAAVGFLLGITGWIVAIARDGVQPGMVILGTLLSLIALIADVIFVTGGIEYLVASLRGY
jgi:hypothetical protein